MKKKWTRRNFLRTSLGSPLVVGATLSRQGTAQAAQQKPKTPAEALSAAERATLRAAIDEIIPAADDMPSASSVGGVDYLSRVAREDAAIRKAVGKCLKALEDISRKLTGKQFTSLAGAQRIETLQAYERQSPEEFVALRNLSYEAYYTQPRVWKLIGYELHPTNESGPHVKPFDEAVLGQVKKMPKRYREVT